MTSTSNFPNARPPLVASSFGAFGYPAIHRLHILCPIYYRRYSVLSTHSPLILVPNGSPFLPIRAHALSPNRTAIPSFRCTSFAHRTTTACFTSPLLTLFRDVLLEPASPAERVFWTTTMMRSPLLGRRVGAWLVMLLAVGGLGMGVRMLWFFCGKEPGGMGGEVGHTYQSGRVCVLSVASRRIRLWWRRSCRCSLASSVLRRRVRMVRDFAWRGSGTKHLPLVVSLWQHEENDIRRAKRWFEMSAIIILKISRSTE